MEKVIDCERGKGEDRKIERERRRNCKRERGEGGGVREREVRGER